MGLIKIDDQNIWGCSRGLLHVVLDYVADRAGDIPFAETLKSCIVRNESSFYFNELDIKQKKLFYLGVSDLVKNWWTFRDVQDDYDKSAFEYLSDLRDRLKNSIEVG